MEINKPFKLQAEISTVAEDARHFWCRFVRAGRVRGAGNKDSRIVIDPEALSTSASKGMFDGKAVFVDHAGWFEYPSLQKLAGFTMNSTWNSAEETVEGEIQLHNTPTGQVMSQLDDELLDNDANSPDVGLSIVFYPQWEEDKDSEDYRIVGIDHVESVDFVFQPAADGRVLQALSSFAVEKSIQKLSQEEIQMPEELEVTQEVAEEEVASAENVADEIELWTEAARRSASRQMINASGLPELARERLLRQTFASPEEVTAAIEAEREYIAQLHADQGIQIGGSPPRSPAITNVLTSMDRIEAATEAMLAGVRPANGIAPLTGIRELYHLLSGDFEMNGVFNPDRISFANVNSSTMSNLVANVLNKRVINEFQVYPQWWMPIVSEEDFQTLQNVRWISLGGIGELPTVAEGAAYTELTWDDSYESATFVKKGGYLGLTIEAIDKDDTGRIRAAPRALAQAAWLTLSKAVSAIFTANSGTGPTMVDTLALFEAGTHANLGTTALSWAEYVVVRTAMRKQTELHSSERLGALTAPKFILVPPDLEITALQVLASEGVPGTANNDENVLAEGDYHNARMMAARDRVIVVDLWTDTNNWAAVCDPQLYPTIGIAYRYGRQPEIFSVASPTAGLMFTNDTMPIKVRFFYAVGPMDWRGMYKENVA